MLYESQLKDNRLNLIDKICLKKLKNITECAVFLTRLIDRLRHRYEIVRSTHTIDFIPIQFKQLNILQDYICKRGDV